MSNAPNKPKAPASGAPTASGIQVESNDTVSPFDQVRVESVIEDRGGGLTVETFTGLRPDVDWVETSTAPVIPADAFGAE